MRIASTALSCCVAVLLAGATTARAQEARLVGKLPDAARAQIQNILEAARSAGLPTEPLVDRALEGAVKRAPVDRIIAAVARLRDELGTARVAFGEPAQPAELIAGASALRAGAAPDDLMRLRTLRPAQSLTIAAGVLADLVAAGVPADTGIAAVLALAPNARDADYVAFRRNVERDIALGASPAASIGARLQAVSDMVNTVNGPTTGSTNIPRKRKP
jgi:hypothetical protein